MVLASSSSKKLNVSFGQNFSRTVGGRRRTAPSVSNAIPRLSTSERKGFVEASREGRGRDDSACCANSNYHGFVNVLDSSRIDGSRKNSSSLRDDFTKCTASNVPSSSSRASVAERRSQSLLDSEIQHDRYQ